MHQVSFQGFLFFFFFFNLNTIQILHLWSLKGIPQYKSMLFGITIPGWIILSSVSFYVPSLNPSTWYSLNFYAPVTRLVKDN